MAKGIAPALSSPTRAKLACFLLITAWACAAWPDLLSMIKTYKNSGYDYQGFLALPLFFFLIQRQRNLLNRAHMTSSPLSLLILLLCCATWLFASLAKLSTIEQIALIGMLPAIVMTSCGSKVSSILAFPLLSLFLLLPLGHNLYNFLQQIFSSLLVHILAFCDVAVYWEDQKILISKQEYSLPQLCVAFKYTTLFITTGILYAAIQSNNFFKRVLILSGFVILPFTLLLTATLSLILISTWLKFNSISSLMITAISYTIVGIGILFALYLGFILRTKNQSRYKNDGIDWRNEGMFQRSRWMTPTILAAVVILIMPSTAKYLQQHQHYAKNWYNPNSITNVNSAAVALTINYDNIAKQDESYDPKNYQQVKKNNLKVAVNNKIVPVTETILIDKYHGKITWSVNYTNGHLSNNETYTKVLENFYSLTKPGAKSAQINLTTGIDSNLKASRKILTQSLIEIQRTATTTWLHG